MTPFGLAWRSLSRQPARAALGVAGVAIVGALLLDMLLLSRGLVLSFGEMLDSAGYDVRITASDAPPGNGPRIGSVESTKATLERLPEIDRVVPLRFGRARHERLGRMQFLGTSGPAEGHWTLTAGRPLRDDPATGRRELLINGAFARDAGVDVGDPLSLRGRCSARIAELAPVEFAVVGIAEMRFDAMGNYSAVTTMRAFEEACGLGVGARDQASLLLVASAADVDTVQALSAIRATRPDLHVFSNEELLALLQVRDFSYFRQISFVLSTMTLLFAFLLIATLLTVSVNQRLAEVAALRALGFSRRRVVADLIWESAMLVGAGGLLSWPLAALLAGWLDGILRSMGGIPDDLHFFVFQPSALFVQAVLLVGTGLSATLYPVVLAARLPIAATLRKEVVS